jgi:phosphoribosylanthranilate isomerase
MMKIKVCGNKYKENIEQVAQLRPDSMGFIFYEPSKRYVTEEFQMPALPAGIKKTGVFVNADADFIIDKINTHNLDCIQLHGDEPPYFCRQMQRITCIIKAFGIDDKFDFQSLDKYKDSCNYFLFDTKTTERGGSGQQFNWDQLKKYNLQTPFFLSGGLDLEAAKKIVTMTEEYPLLYGMDVNSKFETSPGLKDIPQLKQLMQLIRQHQ